MIADNNYVIIDEFISKDVITYFIEKHLDEFQKKNNRTVSLLLYYKKIGEKLMPVNYKFIPQTKNDF